MTASIDVFDLEPDVVEEPVVQVAQAPRAPAPVVVAKAQAPLEDLAPVTEPIIVVLAAPEPQDEAIDAPEPILLARAEQADGSPAAPEVVSVEPIIEIVQAVNPAPAPATVNAADQEVSRARLEAEQLRAEVEKLREEAERLTEEIKELRSIAEQERQAASESAVQGQQISYLHQPGNPAALQAKAMLL
jgi:hypothetical protein